jgi:hypothetical protein
MFCIQRRALALLLAALSGILTALLLSGFLRLTALLSGLLVATLLLAGLLLAGLLVALILLRILIGIIHLRPLFWFEGNSAELTINPSITS